MMSGKVSQESIERISEDQLVPLHVITETEVSQKTSRIIQAGLALKASERYQNLDAFIKALYPEKQPSIPLKSPEEKQTLPSEFHTAESNEEIFSPIKWLAACFLFFFVLGVLLSYL